MVPTRMVVLRRCQLSRHAVTHLLDRVWQVARWGSTAGPRQELMIQAVVWGGANQMYEPVLRPLLILLHWRLRDARERGLIERNMYASSDLTAFKEVDHVT